MSKSLSKKFSRYNKFNISCNAPFLTPKIQKYTAIFVFVVAGFCSLLAAAGDSRIATFAGGCFWCMEYPFDQLEGVLSTKSGYTGGVFPNPNYEMVSEGLSGHVEAVQVVFDPSRISYEQLLEVYWRNIDPLQANGQFCDIGLQYKSAIYVNGLAQKAMAESSRKNLQELYFGYEKIVTEILPISVFFEAEVYHQDYYQKNPLKYKLYRYRCGRDTRLSELWDR
jgi:peptide-methionine (S)-S-oxide reductase